MKGFVACLVLSAAACTGTTSPAPARFHEDVEPILQRYCQACHRENGIAPFALLNYDEASHWADQIVVETRARRMPPWGLTGDGSCNQFRDSRWLSDAQLATLQRWIDEGKQRGDPARAPQQQQPITIDTDVVLDIGVDYRPDTTLDDDYRCFIVPTGLAADRFVTGYEVLPGEPRTVHHVIVYSLDSAASENRAAALDMQDATAGYTCPGTSNVPDSRPVIGWAPGTPATIFPDDTGIRLYGNRGMVVQVHYNTSAGDHPDRTRVRMQTRTAVANEAFIYAAAAPNLSVAPGLTSGLVTNELTLTALGVPVGIYVRGVFPHMHRLGTTLKLEAVHDGAPSCMADVRDWDFDWQQFFFYNRPFYVYPDDTVRITCTYDTTSRSTPVRWGEGTNDEMCLVGLYVTLF